MAGGGGAYSASIVSVVPGVGYGVTVGTSAVDTNGGNSSFDAVVLAEGGKSGSNGGTGGSSSNGIGSVRNSGGNGFSGGAGGGGGAAGSLANGSNGTSGAGAETAGLGGDSDGSAGGSPTSGNTIGTAPGAGAATTATSAFEGSRGEVRISYSARVVDRSFPWVFAYGRGRHTTQTSSHIVTSVPGTRATDIVVLALHCSGFSVTVTPPPGWTSLGSVLSAEVNGAYFYRVGPFSPATFTSSASEISSYMTVVVRGSRGTPQGVAALSAASTINPPNLNTGVSAKRIWLAFGGIRSLGSYIVDGPPTNYSDLFYHPQGVIRAVNKGISTFVAHRKLQASSEDPPGFSQTGGQSNTAATIGVAA